MGLFSNNKTFKGGVHPGENKWQTENLPFEIMPDPQIVILPISQHTGIPAKPIVEKSSKVRAGEVIAQSAGFISAPVHSSVSGTIKQIHTEATLSGFPGECIIVQADTENETLLMPPLKDSDLTGDKIRERVKDAGIVGMGGAAFPTYVKLTPPKDKPIDLLILNGCECEPYLTRDFRLMIERPEAVLTGMTFILKALHISKGVLGIEDNKMEAITKLKALLPNFPALSVEVLKTKYPQGAEKMLIKSITGKEVPPGKLPLDIGIVIQNIGTAVAIYDAVVKGEPQLTAALTVSGDGITTPKNLIVKIGTPIQEVLDYCGGMKDNAVKVLVGGPMMGVAQFDFSAPIMKATSGILVLTEKETANQQETPCLKCGKCIEACPLDLLPTKLVRYTQLNKLDEAEKLNITVCMECGTCTFQCPANIPLVQWIRLGKRAVNKNRQKKQPA